MAEIKPTILGHESQWDQLVSMAHQNRLPGALGFIGPSGVGKKMVALAFAQFLLKSPREVPNESVVLLEAAGETFKVDQIQTLKQSLSLRALGTHRLVIIDEAERLNPQSANALLKMIEEPPDKTHFILITASLSSLLPTIRSRLMIMRFFQLSEAALKTLTGSEDWLVKMGRGRIAEVQKWSSEDAETLTKDVVEVLKSLKAKDLDAWIEKTALFKERERSQKLVHLLQLFFRDQVLIRLGRTSEAVLPFSKDFDWKELKDTESLVAGWRKAFAMERSIARNSDRSLMLLNYYYEVTALG